jgi:hypothetical protein
MTGKPAYETRRADVVDEFNWGPNIETDAIDVAACNTSRMCGTSTTTSRLTMGRTIDRLNMRLDDATVA